MSSEIFTEPPVITYKRRRPGHFREMAGDMKRPTDTHILAYLAGIVDGEGCISIYSDGRKNVNGVRLYRLCLSIAMQHRPVLDRFVETFGGKVYLIHTNLHVHRSPYWRVVYMCHKAVHVVRYLRPYLLVKTDQADLAIEFQTTRIRRKGQGYEHPQSYYDTAQKMYETMCAFNHRDSISLRRLVQGS